MLLVNAVNTEGRPLEIFVKDGRIAAVGQELEALAGENETVIDAGGLTVLPAFVDLHCHWRTPGFEYKEDIETGSRAAAAGGYTFVNLMPNTKPVCSSAAQAMMVEQKAAEVGLCDVNQTVSITENFDGVSIDHLKTLPAGVKFITEDGHGVQDNATMAKAFAICTQKDITVMSHAEDMEISPWDYRLAEDIETVRNCWLSEYYQTKLHMCHVSTRGALDAIQMAKLRGAPVTCEVTPHHLWFVHADTLPALPAIWATASFSSLGAGKLQHGLAWPNPALDRTRHGDHCRRDDRMDGQERRENAGRDPRMKRCQLKNGMLNNPRTICAHQQNTDLYA